MNNYKTKVCVICNNTFQPINGRQMACNECHIRKCKYCGKEFYTKDINKIPKGMVNCCSSKCYINYRWKNHECAICGSIVKSDEKHKIVCSEECYIKYRKLDDQKRSQTKMEKARKLRLKLIGILGGKCVDCGLSDVRVLQFNHKDRTLKVRTPSAMLTWRRYVYYEKQIDNLELVCANCHIIRNLNEVWVRKIHING